MSFRRNNLVSALAPPPIAAVQGWIEGRVFPAERPLLDVAQAVPSYPPAEELQDHLARMAKRPATSLYTDILGITPLREALSTHLSASYGGTIRPGDVGITAGCNQAFCIAMTALAAPGEEVILGTPWYFNYQMWLDMQGIGIVPLPCRPDAGMVPDPAEAESLIGERTRAIVLISPNNPTGAIYPAAVIEAFHDLARRRKIALVLDETYKDFLDHDRPAHGIFADPGWRENFVQLYSFSKAYSLTGYRAGAIACGPQLMDSVGKIMDCIAICAPRIGQEAALYGLEHLAGWRAEKRDLMAER